MTCATFLNTILIGSMGVSFLHFGFGHGSADMMDDHPCCVPHAPSVNNAGGLLFLRTTTPGETKLLASEIYEILQAYGDAEAERAESGASCRRKAHFFLGTNNKRAKTVVLQIDGLDDSVGGCRSPRGVQAPGYIYLITFLK